MSLATRNQKAVLHILKKEYDLKDDEYRQFLYDNFNGIDSSTGLSEEQADYCIHLLNYKHNKDYKQGYNKAFELGCGTLLQRFEHKIEMQYERKTTEMEVKMFNNLTREQQIELLEDF